MSSYHTQPDLNGLFPKGSLVGWSYIDREEMDHEMYDLTGESIVFGDALAKNTPAPALFTNRVLAGDLIPQTSWGSSLANLLTLKQWNELRYPVIARNNGVCEFCGKRVGKSLEVHEDWRYHLPVGQAPQGQEIFGRQELVGLMGVCKDCHACFHLGLANVRGHLDKTLHRLRQINGWSAEQSSQYVEQVYQRHERLNEFHWYQDCRLIAPDVESLVVKSSWTPMPETPQILTKESQYGTNIALIAGCSWQFSNSSEKNFTAVEF